MAAPKLTTKVTTVLEAGHPVIRVAFSIGGRELTTEFLTHPQARRLMHQLHSALVQPVLRPQRYAFRGPPFSRKRGPYRASPK